MTYLRMVVLFFCILVFNVSLLVPNQNLTADSLDTPIIDSISIIDSTENKLKTKKVTYKDTLTPKTLYNLIKTMGVKHPEIITAQAIEETGYFKSNLYSTNGNLFGMKLAGSRPTTACSTSKNKYANYKCHKDHVLYSVMDRVMLDAAFYRNLSKEAYYAKLGRTYASNPNYVRNLKKIIQNHGFTFNK